MGFIKALLLGILQGLTEFLPVSSSGHLKLAEYFLGTGEAVNSSFDVFLHLGSLVAVLIYFRKAIFEIIISLFVWRPDQEGEAHAENRRVALFLVIATFFTGIVYVLFQERLNHLFEHASPLFVAGMLVITGAILLISDLLKNGKHSASRMGFLRSAIIGIGQGIAIIPGISRSGTTIATSIMCGVKREDAAQFSFLMSIPAILGANLSILEELKNLDAHLILSYLTGFFAAAVSGYFVIAVLIRLIRKSKLKYFAFYCWSISLLVLLLSIF